MHLYDVTDGTVEKARSMAIDVRAKARRGEDVMDIRKRTTKGPPKRRQVAKRPPPADVGVRPPVDPLPGEYRAKLTLGEFCELMGLDRSTVLRKERQGLLPPRRLLAGMNVFLTAEVRNWLMRAEISIARRDQR
jgi:predicted DNA-binding transcriptional regulator AlpA